jgi:hypothetical protein
VSHKAPHDPTHTEIVGVLDPIRDSFLDILLSGSEDRLSSTPSEASCSPSQECLAANMMEDHLPNAGRLGKTSVSVRIHATHLPSPNSTCFLRNYHRA